MTQEKKFMMELQLNRFSWYVFYYFYLVFLHYWHFLKPLVSFHNFIDNSENNAILAINAGGYNDPGEEVYDGTPFGLGLFIVCSS